MTRFALALLCVSSAAHAGSVKGTVLFEGEPPAQAALKRDSDPKCSKDKADEAIVVTKGKLRDVVVRIKNGTAGKHAAPAQPVLLDQKDCTDTPRVATRNRTTLSTRRHFGVRSSKCPNRMFPTAKIVATSATSNQESIREPVGPR